MARTRSTRISEVKGQLLARLREGLLGPGDRFLSNRAIAAKFGISYQTAHRIVAELAAEGVLERRAASGTYVPGRRPALRGTLLVFHPRARRKASFGARLLALLTARLDAEKIDWRMAWAREGLAPPAARLPVLWEAPDTLAACLRDRRAAVLLNDRAPAGLDAAAIDSVSADEFAGGVQAAELLRSRAGPGARLAIIAGPPHDGRSSRRAEGFRSVLETPVVSAGGWYREDGLRVAAEALQAGPDGIFCCNDRLAEAVLLHCSRHRLKRPPLIGFDDAPIALDLNLTTLAIPWNAMIDGAVRIIRGRLAGEARTSVQQIFAPTPVLRLL